ncbi:hypothetical protein MRB53_014361 [Persea americana]|uniref:Uncharacterized protein n=1 Tax=Persea americana TaxID=3435 RepID=A0ACC2KAI7_PERAE|nr:hypothetical protein MRB53_014361 [Persea americana]
MSLQDKAPGSLRCLGLAVVKPERRLAEVFGFLKQRSRSSVGLGSKSRSPKSEKDTGRGCGCCDEKQRTGSPTVNGEEYRSSILDYGVEDEPKKSGLVEEEEKSRGSGLANLIWSCRRRRRTNSAHQYPLFGFGPCGPRITARRRSARHKRPFGRESLLSLPTVGLCCHRRKKRPPVFASFHCCDCKRKRRLLRPSPEDVAAVTAATSSGLRFTGEGGSPPVSSSCAVDEGEAVVLLSCSRKKTTHLGSVPS